MAYYFSYWRWERNEYFGDLKTGYIINPKLQSNGDGDSPSGEIDYSKLIEQAAQLAVPIRPSEDCCAANVASVIVSRSGEIYTGVSLDFSCSLGFCAEHAAIAEMLKAGESEIRYVVAVDESGNVLPPCGRCREMMWQLNAANRDALVILAPDHALPLRDLLPFR